MRQSLPIKTSICGTCRSIIAGDPFSGALLIGRFDGAIHSSPLSCGHQCIVTGQDLQRMVERKSLDSVAVASDGRGAKQGVVDSFLSSFDHSKKK